MINNNELINQIKSYNKFLNSESLSKAYDFALEAHQNQKREEGVPYIIHPVAVAKILTELNIRTYQHTDMEDVIHIWKECGLIRSRNNPKLDIQRKVKTQNDLFFVAELSNRIIATAMFGYDGHRGWLNYFAVLPQFQKSGYGNQLLEFGEKILFDKGCPKINLQIRADNKEAINFYKAVGYNEDEVISYGKRLIED